MAGVAFFVMIGGYNAIASYLDRGVILVKETLLRFFGYLLCSGVYAVDLDTPVFVGSIRWHDQRNCLAWYLMAWVFLTIRHVWQYLFVFRAWDLKLERMFCNGQIVTR